MEVNMSEPSENVVESADTSKSISSGSDLSHSQTSLKAEGKVDESLIQTILGEMMSEFNKDLDSATHGKSDNSEVKKKDTRASVNSDKKLKKDTSKTANVTDTVRKVRSRRSSESQSPTKIVPKGGVANKVAVLTKENTKESCSSTLVTTIGLTVSANNIELPNEEPTENPTPVLENEHQNSSKVELQDVSNDSSQTVVTVTPVEENLSTVMTDTLIISNEEGLQEQQQDYDVSVMPTKDEPVSVVLSKNISHTKSKSKMATGTTLFESTEISQDGTKVGLATSSLNQENKPRIVITLKTADDTSDGHKKLKLKGSHAEGGSDEVWTVKVDSRSCIPTQALTGKRSLRSHTAKVTPEPEGVKRSARRRSKDLPRESVLQSAIARKEKSFSLGQREEKPGRSPKLRSPLLSPVDKVLKSSETRKALAKATKAEVNNMSMNFELMKVDTTKPTLESSNRNLLKVKQELDGKVVRDPSIMLAIKSAPSSSQTLAYTKTGKRRYKPYKGLRYSLTSGNVTRRSKGASRLRNEELQDSNTSFESQLADVPSIASDCDILGAGGQVDNHSLDEGCQDVEAQPNSMLKRRNPPEGDCSGGDESKRGRQNIVPSPSPGESSQVPAKPESTAISIGAGTAGLCLCQTRSQLFVSTTSSATVGEIYCQAVDSLDDRLIGCCNSIVSPEVRLLRPSKKVPYLILCDVHTQRLLRHNCCPGCGVFCTRGKFVRCSSRHFYHRECQLPGDTCPHCGVDSPDHDSMLYFKSQSNPVFVPQQKPFKKLPSAKMGFVGSGNSCEAVSKDILVDEGIDTSLQLPCERDTSGLRLSPALDKDELQSLINITSNVPTVPAARYTIKSLIHASKTGNAERLINALASGLSPNTIFRDQGHSCLHLASASGSIATVHVLVQAGAEIDMMDKDQNTPLMLAIQTANNAVVKYLIKAGASVTLRGSDGQTALHLAAKAGNLEACHYLLSVANAGRSYINSEDDGGWTPLVWAAELCHTLIAKFLLERRADPLVRDSEQNIALHWAAFSGSVDISEMLLNYGCEVNCVNVHGDSPLHIGARQNMYHCVLLLLMRGAKVAVKNQAGDSPLDCCSVKPSDCHTVINLNMQLQAITHHPARRLLTNDISRGKEINPVQCVNNEDGEGEPLDFVYVSENCYTSNIFVNRTITSLQRCSCKDTCTGTSCHCGNISLKCWYDAEGKLMPDFNFADPPMLFECNPACSCNRITCQNRVVQHGLTCRFQLFRTREKGWGVRTLRAIPKGTYVCEYIGEIISDCEADHREDDSYLFDLDNRDGETFCIDARHYGNVARFINHMCAPNLIPVKVFIDHQDLHFPRIAFFANRDIQPDEELGFDYGEKFWIIKYKSFTCTCGAEGCRYSDTTIQQTLEIYSKKMQLEDSIQF